MINKVAELLKNNIAGRINEVSLELDGLGNRLRLVNDGEYCSLLKRAGELNNELYRLRNIYEKYDVDE